MKRWKKNTESSFDTIAQPPPSVPNAAEHSPAATIAAGPEDEPPVYLSGSCGFLAVLYTKEKYQAWLMFGHENWLQDLWHLRRRKTERGICRGDKVNEYVVNKPKTIYFWSIRHCRVTNAHLIIRIRISGLKSSKSKQGEVGFLW